jgi:hypothetical protein
VSHREQLCKWKLEPVLPVQPVQEQQVLPPGLVQPVRLEPLHHEGFRFPAQIFQPELTLLHRREMRLLAIRSSKSRLRSPDPKLQFHRSWRTEDVCRCA